MKKILMILMMIFSFSMFAQTGFKKSDKFVEGTFSYNRVDDNTKIVVNPKVGYFLTDKLAVGVGLGVTDNSTTTNGDQFSVGLFGRYYLLNVGKDFKVFSELGVNRNTTTDNFNNKDTTTNAGLGLGVNYFVTDRLALTTNLANLAQYTSGSNYGFGFNGVENPFTKATLGLTYKF